MIRNQRWYVLLSVTATALLVLLGAAWLSSASRSAPLRYTWQDGRIHHYAFSWSSSGQARLLGGPTPTRSHTNFTGTLVVRPRVSATAHTLEVGFFALDTVELAIGEVPKDAAAAPLRKALLGPRAVAEVNARGELTNIFFPPTAPAPFKDIMGALLSDLQVILPETAARRWQTRQRTSQGTARFAHELSGRNIARTLVEYDELAAVAPADRARVKVARTGSAKLVLAPEGHPGRFERSESIAVTDPRDAGQPVFATESRLVLEERAVEADPVSAPVSPAPVLTALERRAPGPHLVTASAAAHDRAIAGNTTLADVLGLVTGHRGGPLARGQLASAVAYLRLHPEAISRLGAAFERPGTPRAARELVIDLLASVATPAAQAAMRALVATPAAREDAAAYRSYLQRFVFVDAPEAETADFLRRVESQARAQGQAASADAALVTLGAVVGRRAGAGDPAALAEAAALTQRPQTTRAPRERAAAVMAAGNLGRVRDEAALAALAADPEVDVRYRVAEALQRPRTESGKQALLALLDDRDPGVARMAARSYLAGDPGAAELTTLTTVVSAGRLHRAADAAIVAILERHLGLGPVLDPLLEALLRRADAAGPLAAQIQALLAARRGST